MASGLHPLLMAISQSLAGEAAMASIWHMDKIIKILLIIKIVSKSNKNVGLWGKI